MRFSTNLRDPASYRGESWARRDRPWWLPEAAATLLLDKMDLSPAASAGVLVACCCVAAYLAREIAIAVLEEYRWRRSNAASRELVRQERQQKEVAAAAAMASSAGGDVLSASVRAPGRMVRYCRFCDVRIAEEFVATHEAGKKHLRRREAAGSLATAAESCWVWRAPDATAEASSEEPGAATTEDVRVAPSASATSAGKGLGKWSAAPQPRKRR